jgi:hypothetical protein
MGRLRKVSGTVKDQYQHAGTCGQAAQGREMNDYRADDDAVLRKVTTDALQRVGTTVTQGNSYIDVGCADAGELRMALRGAEMLRRESRPDSAAGRSYYNLECAIRRRLSQVTPIEEKRADFQNAGLDPDQFVGRMMKRVVELKAEKFTAKSQERG